MNCSYTRCWHISVDKSCNWQNKSFTTLVTDLLFPKECLSNWFQKSADLKFADTLDVYEFIHNELHLIDAYIAEDDLEVTDPDEDLDDKVSEE